VRGIAGAPGFPHRRGARGVGDLRRHARHVASTCRTGARRTPTHYAYKLEWLAALRESVAAPEADVLRAT
jgi:exodeoxyribonuclease-3